MLHLKRYLLRYESMNRPSRSKHYIFLCMLLGAFSLLSCSASDSYSNAVKDSKNTENRCFDGSFIVAGEMLKTKDLLGEGGYGKVYSVVNDRNEIIEDIVAKLIIDREEKQIKAHLKQELLLSKAFPDHYTFTHIVDQFRYINETGDEFGIGILVKQRIYGDTLEDIVNSQSSKYLDTPNKIRQAFEELERFKYSLSLKMQSRSPQNIFMGDLHGDNIMYDGSKWYVVDATALDSRDALSMFLEEPGFDDFLSTSLIAKIESPHQILDSDFFNTLIDVQLGEPYQRLRKLYNETK